MQDIGVRIGVQGEKEYRQSIANIVQTSKELSAEMKAMTSGFDDSASAQDQARQKMDLLNRQIQNQTKYIDLLKDRYKAQESVLSALRQKLDQVNEEYGEGSKEAQALTSKIQSQETAMSKTRTSINNATTALNNMQSEMSQTESAASGAATSTKDLADAVEEAGDSADKASGGWSIFGQMVADFASNVARSALNMVKDLAKEAISVNDQMIKFQNTMEFAGFGADEVSHIADSMKEYADKTVYSLGEVSNIVAQLGANGVENFEELVEAAGNLNAAAGGSASTFSTFGLVLTQTAGVGKLTTENWKQLMNSISGASGSIKDALLDAGAYVGSFEEAMQKGEITAEEFNQAILQIGSQPIAVEAATSVETFEGKLAQLKSKGIDILTNALKILSPAIDLVFKGLDAILTPISKLISAFSDGTTEVDKYTTATSYLTTAVDEWDTAQEEINTKYETGQGLMEHYKGRLKDLEDQMWKAKAAGDDYTAIQAEYSEIVGILNENIPDLNLTINEQNGLLDYNSKMILENADAWAEAKKAQAWQDQFTDILAQQAKAEAELETNRVKLKIATDDYNAATKRSAELQTELDSLWTEFYSGASDDPEALKKKIDEVTAAWEAENQKVKDAEDSMNDYSKAVETGEQAMEEISAEVETAKQVFDELMESQGNYAESTKRVLFDEVVPLYAQAARDASRKWNSNLSVKAYNPTKATWTTISAYKTGLAYVPYDGFIAELHKGERILTAAEALEYRNLRSPEVTITNPVQTPDLSTINNNQRTSVVMNVYGAEGQDEETLADIVMDRLQRSVNRQEALYA